MGQPLLADTQSLLFDPTDETQTRILSLDLENPHDTAVHILAFRLYDTYGQPAFTVDQDSATLLPGQSITLQVTFQPRHNIFHQSELIVETDSRWGSLRIDLQGQGIYSLSYYQSTQDLSEEALKQALKTRLGQGYQSLGYTNARNEMFMEIDNQRVNGQGASVNTLEGVYTGFTLTNYSSRTQAQNQGMNTEHTWPQSKFGNSGSEPMRSDLFHIFPTEQNANSTRGSDPFGMVSNPTWQQGGSKGDNSRFEPRDQQKGRTARAMMYFVLRYQNYENFMNSQESILRTWHEQFPADVVETNRNEAIFTRQQNRNPFIDYPQFAERITSLASNSLAPSIRAVDWVDQRADLGNVVMGDTLIFTGVLVNTGNEEISLSNISWHNPQIDLDSSLSNLGPIAPGDAATLAIRLIATQVGNIQDTLSFNVNVPALEQGRLPISAAVSGSSRLPSRERSGWQLAPNPASQSISLIRRSPDRDIRTGRLLNAQGQEVLAWQIPAGSTRYVLPVEHLPLGMYWLWLDGQLLETVSLF